MILAGIDEAGYGPVLGPLVVGACAVHVPDLSTDSTEGMPCIWTLLSGTIGRKKSAHGRKLHINDSKAVYSPSSGLKELERSVLCMARLTHGKIETLRELFDRASDLDAFVSGYKWYASELDEQFPLSIDAATVAISHNALKLACLEQKVEWVYYHARVLLEREFNHLVERTRNKASTSFMLVAWQMDQLMQKYGMQNLTIVCDRQGGREHYGQLLRTMFEEWKLEIMHEESKRSDYRLIRGNQSVRIIFSEKAESFALPVAAASMLAKYARETLMHRFNRYWQGHQPDLKPTAGYYTDGMRFLQDIEPLRKQMRLADVELIRQR